MSTRPTGFEERLKAALLARLPEAPPPAPARPFARRYGIPLAVGVATAAVIAVMTMTGSTHTGSLPAGTPSPSGTDAPRITKERDGSLRFDLPRQEQIPALAARLKQLGVEAVWVQPVPERECRGATWTWGKVPQPDPAAGVQRGDDGRTLKVNPKAVPPGHTLALSWKYYPPYWDGKQGIVFGVLPNEYAPFCAVDNTETALEAQRLGPPTHIPSPPPGVPPTKSP
ncbi:hypothetical protein ABZY83_16900 [Streptomyces virginiae]|uniref:hypothetical protein n=1 Tax=Streptomyces TaxID=1883 RepID=UPI0006AE9F9C|nr:hypothetical protein [Streptomyces sp. XY66]KOU71162.1 hypothetical protein ADK61_31695 [Streptomyces sp. XY66]